MPSAMVWRRASVRELEAATRKLCSSRHEARSRWHVHPTRSTARSAAHRSARSRHDLSAVAARERHTLAMRAWAAGWLARMCAAALTHAHRAAWLADVAALAMSGAAIL